MTLKEVIKQLGIKLIGWVKSNCVNNLLSDRADLPLAAAQGKVIDEKITALNSNINTFSDKDKLGSLTSGSTSYDATNYKYIYITSVGGATLVPVPVLRLLGTMSISHIRRSSDSYAAYIYMQIRMNELVINQYDSSGWAKSEIAVYGLK